jgi:hypothetical protein
MRRPNTSIVLVAMLALAVVGTGTALATSTPSSVDAGRSNATSGSQTGQNRPGSINAAALTWADDFDGPAGSAPDPGKWVRETGGSGWGNQELEYYTNSNANSALDGAATWWSPPAGRTRPATAAGTAHASTHRRG